MERLAGVVLRDIIRRFASGKRVNMLQLANGLKTVLVALDGSNCYHGDLHDENIMVDMNPSGDIENVQVIDFGNSLINKPKPNMNLTGISWNK